MSRLRKFLSLSLADQWLVIKVAFLLGAVRMGLSLLPFQKLRQQLAQFSGVRKTEPDSDLELRKVTTAVEIVSRRAADHMTCLTKALVTQLLLQRRGYPVELRIGVARAGSALEAHAWVEYRQQVIMGLQKNMERYVLMPSWEGKGL